MHPLLQASYRQRRRVFARRVTHREIVNRFNNAVAEQQKKASEAEVIATVYENLLESLSQISTGNYIETLTCQSRKSESATDIVRAIFRERARADFFAAQVGVELYAAEDALQLAAMERDRVEGALRYSINAKLREESRLENVDFVLSAASERLNDFEGEEYQGWVRAVAECERC